MIEGARVLALALLIASAPLDDAAAALVAGDAEACGKLAQEALATGALDVADVARAWTLRAKCFTLAGDADRAERSYGVALRVDPAVVVDGDESFARAKRSLPAVSGMVAHATFVADDALAIELDGDDLLLVKGASVVRAPRADAADDAGDEEVARVPLEVGQARHKVSGIVREALTLVLLDKHGNALARVPVAADVTKTFTPEPAPPGATRPGPTILTTLGATAIGAAMVGVVTSGIALAALGQAARDEEGQLWVVGVGASTGLFLVGAGMVVVDQGL